VAALSRLIETQGPDAAETAYLWGGLGMSLTTAWFKSGYSLPLHTHNADCLYYIERANLSIWTTSRTSRVAGDGARSANRAASSAKAV
jgi:hypothetical protein